MAAATSSALPASISARVAGSGRDMRRTAGAGDAAAGSAATSRSPPACIACLILLIGSADDVAEAIADLLRSRGLVKG